jgi:hypothetical protein
MGTRGTLRVYLDGKLKIRQYNQWDSYPTGQLAGICRILASESNRKVLVERLKHLAFYTDEEVDGFDKEGVNEFEKAKYLYTTDRDWGYNIIDLLCIMPSSYYGSMTEEGESVQYKLADWAKVFGEEDLPAEEGNYVVHLHSKDCSFSISGDWHDVKMDFGLNEIPDKETLKEWEKKGSE